MKSRKLVVNISLVLLGIITAFGVYYAIAISDPSLTVYLLLPVLGVLLSILLKSRAETLSSIVFWGLFSLLSLVVTIPVAAVMVFLYVMLGSGVSC